MDIVELAPEHFERVIALGNLVHGENYLDAKSMQTIYQKGLSKGINASFVALDGDELIGFRLTYAPANWQTDQWCSTDKWRYPVAEVCYFKCNTVVAHARGHGIGGRLLKASVDAVKQQGAKAGVSHIWLQSPGNSAFKYFTKAGGELIKVHPKRWLNDCIEHGYQCTLCGTGCDCDAGEMLLDFSKLS